MPSPNTRADPTVAEASPSVWSSWLRNLLLHGPNRIAALGLTLIVGFIVALLALFVFASIADEIAEQETLYLDTAVLFAMQQIQSPPLSVVALFASALGAELLAVLLVSIEAALVLARRCGAAVGLFLTVFGAQMLNNVLKDWFHRTRPAPVDTLIQVQAFSFPSGHSMVAAAFYFYLGYLAWRLLGGWARVVCVAGLAVIVLAIGLSRLYLGVHFFTDVVAGYAAGYVWTHAVIIGGQMLARRPGGSNHRPAAVHSNVQPSSLSAGT